MYYIIHTNIPNSLLTPMITNMDLIPAYIIRNKHICIHAHGRNKSSLLMYFYDITPSLPTRAKHKIRKTKITSHDKRTLQTVAIHTICVAGPSMLGRNFIDLMDIGRESPIIFRKLFYDTG